MKRLHSIDIMRSLALLFMVLVHFVENMTYWEEQQGRVYDLVAWVGIMSAPMFTFLVGASFLLSARKRSAQTLIAYTARRGLAIFIFGFGHMLINWGAEALFNWDILTFIGSALFVLLLVRRWPKEAVLALMALVWLASPFLRDWTNYNAHWDFATSEYYYALTFSDIFLGWLLHGTFPIFPWIVFPLGGYLAGGWLFQHDPQAARRGARWLLGGGLGLAALGWWGEGFLGPVYGGEFTFYPAAPTYLLWMLGVDAVLLALFWLLLDAPAAAWRRWWQGSWPHRVTERFSRYSLSLYILHHSVHLWPLYAAGWLLTGDRWFFYSDAMPLAASLGFVAAFLLAVWLLLDGWEANEGRYSLEWLLARLVRG